ncbi:MAG TPA: M67 family metallopeptidase [Candidatus Kryptonia bacterium]
MIRLKKDQVRQIYRHVERTYPEEGCGFMLGENSGESQTVRRVFEINNSQDENRKRRFLITPEQYMQAERIAAEHRMDLLGFYHSHPDHPAIPSAFDTEHALPLFAYLIVSLAEGKSKTMSGWRLSESRERFIESNLIVENLADEEITTVAHSR